MDKIKFDIKKEFLMGNKFYLEVNRNGFTLWDIKDKRWVLDASTFVADGEITLVTDKFKQRVNKYMHKRIFEWRKKWLN